jgi:hypothetical protein
MQKGFQSFSGILAAGFAVLFFSLAASGQTIVDKTVATVSDGSRTELITLSDLRWQLALMPNVDLEPANSENLNRALQLLINQRLFALEAERIPQPEPTEAEIAAKINEMVSYFPSTLDFVRRLQAVGFASIEDDNFQRIVRDRVAIDKYLEFRFRSFIVITPADEAAYYRDTFVPEFRESSPGAIIPSIEEKRTEIRSILTEERIAEAIEAFLDESKRRAEIVYISPV